jgi:hypothetical protein
MERKDPDLEQGVLPEVLNTTNEKADTEKDESASSPTQDISHTRSVSAEGTLSEGTILPDIVDKYVVNWDGDQDPDNPLNWTLKKKWKNLTIVSLITLIT